MLKFLDNRLPDRFWDKVMPEPNSGCWLWIASLDGRGYGQFGIGNRRNARAHRFAYEAMAPIPAGLDLDHLCRTRCCVNPAHLEPVTRRENLMRGVTIAARFAQRTHCDCGRAFDSHRIRAGKLAERFCSFCANRWRGRQPRRVDRV